MATITAVPIVWPGEDTKKGQYKEAEDDHDESCFVMKYARRPMAFHPCPNSVSHSKCSLSLSLIPCPRSVMVVLFLMTVLSPLSCPVPLMYLLFCRQRKQLQLSSAICLYRRLQIHLISIVRACLSLPASTKYIAEPSNNNNNSCREYSLMPQSYTSKEIVFGSKLSTSLHTVLNIFAICVPTAAPTFQEYAQRSRECPRVSHFKESIFRKTIIWRRKLKTLTTQKEKKAQKYSRTRGNATADDDDERLRKQKKKRNDWQRGKNNKKRSLSNKVSPLLT